MTSIRIPVPRFPPVIAKMAAWIRPAHDDARELPLLHRPTTFLPDPLAEFTSGEDDSPPLLRYYLGYYIMPALAAQWLGLAAMNWAVPLWTWLGVTKIVTGQFTSDGRIWSAEASF